MRAGVSRPRGCRWREHREPPRQQPVTAPKVWEWALATLYQCRSVPSVASGAGRNVSAREMRNKSSWNTQYRSGVFYVACTRMRSWWEALPSPTATSTRSRPLAGFAPAHALVFRHGRGGKHDADRKRQIWEERAPQVLKLRRGY